MSGFSGTDLHGKFPLTRGAWQTGLGQGGIIFCSLGASNAQHRPTKGAPIFTGSRVFGSLFGKPWGISGGFLEENLKLKGGDSTKLRTTERKILAALEPSGKEGRNE